MQSFTYYFHKSIDNILIEIFLYNLASKNPAKPCIVPVDGMVNSTSAYRELSIGSRSKEK